MHPPCPRCGEWFHTKDVVRDGLLRYRWCSACKVAFDCADDERRPPRKWWRFPAWLWRHRHCWSPNRRHDWLYYGPGGSVYYGGTGSRDRHRIPVGMDGALADRKCMTCQVED